MKKPSISRRLAAFSLIELVVVIAIIAIIASFTVPAATSILRGSAITQASQMLTDQVSLARQLALSKNRSIEVRFYAYADPEAPGEGGAPTASNVFSLVDDQKMQFRGIQLFEVLESGVAVPIDKAQRLPTSVVMNPGEPSASTFSSLIRCAAANTPTVNVPVSNDTNPELPRGVGRKYAYVAFRFLQDGSTNLSSTQAGGWFVTIHNIVPFPKGGKLEDANKKPINFFTLQIDPVSGATKGFRPTAA